jgi:hypothetical protein
MNFQADGKVGRALSPVEQTARINSIQSSDLEVEEN